jgi:hypothetical protein
MSDRSSLAALRTISLIAVADPLFAKAADANPDNVVSTRRKAAISLNHIYGLDASMRPCFALAALVWHVSGVTAAGDSSLSVALMGLDGQQATLTLLELDALP